MFGRTLSIAVSIAATTCAIGAGTGAVASAAPSGIHAKHNARLAVAPKHRQTVRPAARLKTAPVRRAAATPVRPATGTTPPTLSSTTQSLSYTAFPNFAVSSGGQPYYAGQTENGASETLYGLTPGMSADQKKVALAGLAQTASYPASSSVSNVVAAAAVRTEGLPSPLTGQPCSTPTAGTDSLALLTGGTNPMLEVTGQESAGFPAPTAAQTQSVAAGALGMSVLSAVCDVSDSTRDHPTLVALAYPGHIETYTDDGTTLSGATSAYTAPTNPSGVQGQILAIASVPADSGYTAPGLDPATAGNVLLALIEGYDLEGNPTLEVSDLQPVRTGSTLQTSVLSDRNDTTLPLTGVTLPTRATNAALSFDFDATGGIAVAATVPDANGVNQSWIGLLGGGPPIATSPSLVPALCQPTGRASMDLKTLPAKQGANGPSSWAAACATGSSTTVQLVWGQISADGITMTGLTTGQGQPRTSPDAVLDLGDATAHAVTPYVEFPCQRLLTAKSTDANGNLIACDASTDDNGTAVSAVATAATSSGPQLIQPGAPGTGLAATARAIESTAGDVPMPAELPIMDGKESVTYDNATAVRSQSTPSPIAYIQPPPTVGGLQQNGNGNPELSLSSTSSSSTSHTLTFTVGASIKAGIGVPEIAAEQEGVALEASVSETDGSSNTYTTDDSYASSLDEPTVVFSTVPEWKWTGSVTHDSTGLSFGDRAPVESLVPTGEPGYTTTGTVSTLADQYPDSFGVDGTYATALQSIFGNGVFGSGPYTGDGNPGDYPTMTDNDTSVDFSQDGVSPETGYCDGTTTSPSALSSLKSGVPSPFTLPDPIPVGAGVLTSAQHDVSVGNDNYEGSSVEIDTEKSETQAAEFGVSLSEGAEVGDGAFEAEVDAGVTNGAEATLSVGSGTQYSSTVGNITGDGNNATSPINTQLASETYAWQLFLCHHTMLVDGNLTSALVLGTAVNDYTGSGALAAVSAPTPKSPVDNSSFVNGSFAFAPNGVAFGYQVQVQGVDNSLDETLPPVLAQCVTGCTDSATALAGRSQLTAPQPTDLRPGHTYRWRVTATDYNGRSFTSDWSSFLDPATPTAADQSVTLPVGQPAVNINVLGSATGSGESNPAYTVQTIGQPASGRTIVNPNGTINYHADGDPQPDQFQYTVTDSDTGLTSAPATVYVGVTPATTSLTAQAGNSTVADGSQVSLTATVTSAGFDTPSDTVYWYDGGTFLGQASFTLLQGQSFAQSSPLPVTLSPGTHDDIYAVYHGKPALEAAQSDPITVVVTPPGGPSITAPDGGTTVDANPSVTFTTPSGETAQCAVDGAAATACTSPWTPGPLSEGHHTLSVVATDSAGNSSNPSTVAVNVDSYAPTVQITSPGSRPIQDSVPATFSVRDADDAASSLTVQCQVDGGTAQPCSSPFAFGSLADGQHTLTVSATDPVGNEGDATTTFTVDDSAPQVTITHPSAGQSVSGTIAVNAVATDDTSVASARLFVDGKPSGTVNSAPYTWALNTASLTPGTHTVSATATDEAGNSAGSAPVQFTVDNAAPATGVHAATAVAANGQPALTAQWHLPASDDGAHVCVTTSTSTLHASCPGTDVAADAAQTVTTDITGGHDYRVWVFGYQDGSPRVFATSQQALLHGSATRISQAQSRPTDKTITVHGVLVKVGNTRISGTLALWSRVSGASTWNQVGSATARPTQYASVTVPRPTNTTYYQWHYAGTSYYVASSSARLTVAGSR